jgi:hypothetical protein
MRAYKRGEDEDKCSIATGGHIAKTLEVPV